MSSSRDIARWLRYALSDGPLPSRLIHEALKPNGWPTTDDDQLNRARKIASVTTRRRGTFTAGWWEVSVLGDDRQLSTTPWAAHACVVCGWTAQLPLGTWRRCIHTPSCPGTYQPQPSPPHPHPSRKDTKALLRARPSRSQPGIRGPGRSIAPRSTPGGR